MLVEDDEIISVFALMTKHDNFSLTIIDFKIVLRLDKPEAKELYKN
jgi:hypothetical protein